MIPGDSLGLPWAVRQMSYSRAGECGGMRGGMQGNARGLQGNAGECAGMPKTGVSDFA